MIYKIEYQTQFEREQLLFTHSDKYLIEENNHVDGNFLVFTDIEPIENEIEQIKQDNIILKAQTQANADRAEFQEEVITEIIMALYA